MRTLISKLDSQIAQMMSKLSAKWIKWTSCLSALILCHGCLSWQETTISSDWVYQAISNRDLSQLEHRIATFERIGLKSSTVQIAKQWLYLMTCVPIPQSDEIWHTQTEGINAEVINTESLDQITQISKLPILWQIFSLQLKLEELRRVEAQFLYERGLINAQNFWRSVGHQREWLEKSDFFEYFTTALDLSKWSSWPENEEGWPDEIPAQLSIESRCHRSLSAQGQTQIQSQQQIRWLKAQYFEKVDQLLSQTKMPNQSWDHWQWWYLYDQAITELKWINHDIGWPYEDQEIESSSWQEIVKSRLKGASRWAYYQKSCQTLSKLSQHPISQMFANVDKTNTQEEIRQEEIRQEEIRQEEIRQEATKIKNTNNRDFDLNSAMNTVYFLTGICQLDLKQASVQNMLDLWAKIDLDRLSGDQLSLIQYQKLKYLSSLQDWQSCLKLDVYLPPSTSKIYAPFVYQLGQSFDRSGQEDRFLSFGMKIFRDKGWRKDPFLRALFYLFVRKLTKFSFEEKVVEILEDLGERAFTYERVLIFSEMALDEGMIPQGIQSAQWLLSRHDHAQAKYQYHALLAFAYFLDQKPQLFQNHIQQIIDLKNGILDAIPIGRRAEFFKPRDLALTHVFRLVLPKIAEMEDENSRDFWLKQLTLTIQSFLRLRADSKLKSDLLDLYRVASQMLSTSQARSYPELIGKTQRPTLVLGEARLNALNVSPYEPRSLQWESASVWRLMMIPHHQSPEAWTQSWIKSKDEIDSTWTKAHK